MSPHDADESGMTGSPTARDCERCLSEIARLYDVDDPMDALPAMTPGDAQDVLVLVDAVADDRPASTGHPPTCATCGAVFGTS